MTQYVKAVVLWKDRTVATARDLAGALEDYRADYVFHSLRMDGDEEVTPGLVREVLDGGGADAWALFLAAFDQRRPFSPELLLEFHARLTQGPRAELSGDAAVAVAELADTLRNVRERSALVAAAYLLAELEKLRPFARGNGRTARAVANYLLVLHDHPPVIFYEEDRRDYRTVIDASDSEQRLAPLVDFLREEAAKTWAEEIRRAEEDNRL